METKRRFLKNKFTIIITLLVSIAVIFGVIIKFKFKDRSVIVDDNNSTNYVNEHSIDETDSFERKSKVHLDVPLINQLPELYNGCEITALTMLLNYKGVAIDKITLANEMPKDNSALIRDENGAIHSWGNPKNGFVGDVEGDDSIGYAIDPEPLLPLVKKYSKTGALNLSGTSLEDIEISLSKGNPVLVWVTADLSRPYDFLTWVDNKGNEVEGTFQTHAILLTGYDENNFYYNDPLSQLKDAAVNKETFETVWDDMGSKALTVK